MGHEIEKIALSRGHEVVCKIDIDNPQDFDSPEFKSADVAIEFTAPTQAYSNIMKCFRNGVKVVSGSTGWMGEHSQEMQDLCKDGANTLFWSSNFSIGVALFAKVNKYLAKLTAITLAEDIVSQLDRKTGWCKGTVLNADGTISGSSEYAPSDIRVDSIREGEIAGIHEITYDSSADFIKIIHFAKDRSGLALGAVLAAEYTADKKGFLRMDDLMNSLS